MMIGLIHMGGAPVRWSIGSRRIGVQALAAVLEVDPQAKDRV